MIKRKFFLKLFIVVTILTISFSSIVFSNYDQTDVSTGNCDDGHYRDWITISTNYTGNSVILAQGETFDLEVTATGQLTGDVWIGYAFWHTGSDNIQLPDTSSFIIEDNLVNEWNDGDDYYANFAWQSVVNPMTRTFRINTTSLEGVETLTIQVAGEGTGGNGRYSNVISFSISLLETNAPSVSITAPIDNEYIGGTSVSIDATVDDGIGSGVNTVWAEITNATYNETVFMSGLEPSYSGTWDSTVVTDGIYTLTVKAVDNQSNLNNTESIAIKIDTTAPDITIESIIPDPSKGLTTITASNSSSDINGNGIRATISPPIGGDMYLDLNYQGSNIWNNTFMVTQMGDYYISINATDLASNTVVRGPTAITGDITLPNVVITSPLEGQLVGGNVSITGTTSGTGSIIASIYINNSLWGDGSQAPQIDTATGNLSGDFSFENNSYIVPGLYWVEVNITDAAGNINSTVRSFNFTHDDITPPTITLQASSDLSNGLINFTITSDENLVEPPMLNITLPNSSVIYLPTYLIGINTWRTDYTIVNDGIHTIAVNGTDLSSNTGYAFKTIIGDVTAPTITLSVTPDPSNGITLIEVYNTTESLSAIFVNISVPSGEFLYPILTYQGSNKWNATFIVTVSGIYTISVNGTDLAGNVGYNSQDINGDVDGPIITIVGVSPNPSNGLATIIISNSSSDIDGNGIRANVTAPSAEIIFIELVYQGSNQWLGNFTVTEDGTYTIWINATDNFGDTSYLGPIIVNGDFSEPIIIVNSPSNADSGFEPPDFDVNITDVFIDQMWYTIFDGIKWSENIFFIGATGTIDETLWESIITGEIIIRFYANDSLGNIGYEDIGFLKDVESEEEDDDDGLKINGIQLVTISTILGISIVGGVVILKFDTKRKRPDRCFESPYENAYYAYYGKKLKKRNS